MFGDDDVEAITVTLCKTCQLRSHGNTPCVDGGNIDDCDPPDLIDQLCRNYTSSEFPVACGCGPRDAKSGLYFQLKGTDINMTCPTKQGTIWEADFVLKSTIHKNSSREKHLLVSKNPFQVAICIASIIMSEGGTPRDFAAYTRYKNVKLMKSLASLVHLGKRKRKKQTKRKSQKSRSRLHPGTPEYRTGKKPKRP